MPAGRPKIEISWKEFDKLAELQCTLAEIASWFNCSEDTIERRVVEEHGVNFAEHFKQKSGKGKIALRRRQLQMAEKHPAMAIFLGKNYLNQTDKREETIIKDRAERLVITFEKDED